MTSLESELGEFDYPEIIFSAFEYCKTIQLLNVFCVKMG